MSDTVVVRFAPSPTGLLHLGNLRTALFNWLLARSTGGRFILRIEDTDRERYLPEAEQDYLDGLRWLGLEWDEGPDVGGPNTPYRQSERLPLYHEIVQQLLESGLAYRCMCSPDRLARIQARLKTQVYDNHCRDLNIGPTNEPHVIRLRAPLTGQTQFTDAVRGLIAFENKRLPGDVVLLKSDGYPTYHLAVVTDDHAMGVTHVLRGDEWIASTPLHVLLYQMLGWRPPQFVHLPLVTDRAGAKLTKRETSIETDVAFYRQAGFLPEAMMNYLALLGWHPGGTQEVLTRSDLVECFSITRLSKSPAAFDADRLRWFNRQHIARLSPQDRAERCVPLLMASYPAAATRDDEWLSMLVELVRDELVVLNDVVSATRFAFRSLEDWDEEARQALAEPPAVPVLEAFDSVLQATSDELEADIAQTLLDDLREDFRARHGWTGRAVMFPLRAALTGSLSGPHLADVIALLGKQACLERIQIAMTLCRELESAESET